MGNGHLLHPYKARCVVPVIIRDLYDSRIVAYKTGTQQTVNLVLDTIRLAMKGEKRKVAAELYLRSNQGFQYTSQVYFNLTQEYSLTPSMSRKGNCYDNAMAENFFSILQTECIYRHKSASYQKANDMIDRFIYFYNHERIQLKTGEAPPLHLILTFSYQGLFCAVRTIWTCSDRSAEGCSFMAFYKFIPPFMIINEEKYWFCSIMEKQNV